MRIESQKFKIALTGPPSSGKTTLMKDIQTELGDQVYVVPEAARAFFTENPDLPDRFSHAVQLRIQNRSRLEEAKAEKQPAPIVVCDRIPLDAAAYSYALVGQRQGLKLYFRAAPHLYTYKQIYLLDPDGVPFITDDIRTEDAETRAKIHQGFVDLYRAQNVPHQLLSGSRSDRLAIVLDFIASYTANAKLNVIPDLIGDP